MKMICSRFTAEGLEKLISSLLILPSVLENSLN